MQSFKLTVGLNLPSIDPWFRREIGSFMGRLIRREIKVFVVLRENGMTQMELFKEMQIEQLLTSR